MTLLYRKANYKLQYTSPTIHININTIRIIQSVISVSQTINPIAPIIIVVIAIAANNFIRSIVICILQNKFFHLHYHKILVLPYVISFLVHYTYYFFRIRCRMFRSFSYLEVVFLWVSFCSLCQLKVLSDTVATLKFSFLGFIEFQSLNIICFVLSFTS